MENKILILLMSCNLPKYEAEEAACRETFLKDAEGAGIPYYFYKGTSGETMIDEESHTIYVNAPDNLAGTSKKTVLALNEALKMDDWDYVVKTNVSTWIDIEKVMKAVSCWDGREDRNVYGARYLANEASRNTPFPRGHFLILSRFLVEGALMIAPKLFDVVGFPKTDDTLVGLSLLYHLQKVCGERYLDRLMEVPSVAAWTDEIQEAPEFGNALCIRCKMGNGTEMDETPDNIRKVHRLKKNKKLKRMYRRKVDRIETRFGYITYGEFNTLINYINAKKATEQEKPQVKTEDGNVRRVDPENAMLRIREKLGTLLKK